MTRIFSMTRTRRESTRTRSWVIGPWLVAGCTLVVDGTACGGNASSASTDAGADASPGSVKSATSGTGSGLGSPVDSGSKGPGSGTSGGMDSGTDSGSGSGTSSGTDAGSGSASGSGTGGDSGSSTESGAPAGAFPGQAGNPVGYASCGTLGTTPWPGGDFVSGTAANPTVYKGYVFTGGQNISGSYMKFVSCDFDSGSSGVAVSGSNITFTGNRFQSNNLPDENVQTTGSNLTFNCNSFVPLVSLHASPPGAAWPSAGAGKNTTVQVAGVNSIDGNDAYQYGLNIESGGPVTVDHNDFWGFGNGGPLTYSTTAQINITNNWIHDAANASPQGYHQDGIGYLNGGVGTSNVLVQGNTIASLGNTNAVAFQAATGGYDNIRIIGNYFAGFGYTVCLGTGGGQQFTNSVFENNVFGTDLQCVWGPLYNDYTSVFQQTGNTWSGNTLSVLAGTSPSSSSGFTFSEAESGDFIWPDSSLHGSDFVK
jgi:hypothetical protein